MQLREACNARHEPQAGKAGAAVHIQRVLHAVTHVLGGGVDGAQGAGHALQVLLAGRRHFHTTGRTFKQAHMQQAFELGHLVADG